jgi:HKD family nuclease
MQKLFFRSPREWIRSQTQTQTIDECWIASAYVTDDGFKAIKSLLGNAQIHILTGDKDRFNAPTDLRRILESLRKNIDDAYFSSGGKLHVKVYAVRCQDSVSVLTGSSNLTRFGFFPLNIEFNAQNIITREEWLREWNEMIERSTAQNLSPEIIQKYEEKRNSNIAFIDILGTLHGAKPARLFAYKEEEDKELLIHDTIPRRAVAIKIQPNNKNVKTETWVEIHDIRPEIDQLWFDFCEKEEDKLTFPIRYISDVHELDKNLLSNEVKNSILIDDKEKMQEWLQNFHNQTAYQVTYSRAVEYLKNPKRLRNCDEDSLIRAGKYLYEILSERLKDPTLGYENYFWLRDYITDEDFTEFYRIATRS